MAETNQESCKPHLVMVPFPVQGHIIPMFKLAKLLHHHGFHITFLNTDFNHQRLLRSHGVSSLEGLIPNFNFASIPDGLPPSNDDATQDPKDIVEAARKTLLDPFRKFLSGLSSKNGPPITCILTDPFNGFAIQVAQQLSIPNVQFFILGAGPFLPMVSYQKLIDYGLIPLKGEECYTNCYLDTVVNCIPGLEGMPLKYLPSWMLVTDANHPAIEPAKELCDKSLKGSSSIIITNSFEELESAAIKQLSSLYSTKVLAIGPIHLLENMALDDELYSFGGNLWKEDASCLKWLDSKPPGSVLFVSFGTMTRFTAQQIVELAWGLANSKHYFLWVIRPDLVMSDEGSTALSPEFEVEIKERGFLTSSWCPQEKVLQHPAVGGFLTQCGWNSLLESLCAGIPVLCCPNWSEQVTNGWFCCNRWRMGLEIDNIRRNEVESLVRVLMSGEKGQDLKKKSMEWKKKAHDSCLFGSSHMNFHQLMKLLRSLQTGINLMSEIDS